MSTALQRFKVLVHVLHQRAERSQQKARTPDLRTRIDTEILRIHGNIHPMLLFSSISRVRDSNRISSQLTKLIFQYNLGRIERTHKDGRAAL
jgi:hypothetical protein